MTPFPLAGEVAALATAVFWSLSAIAWALAGRRVGSVAVTTIRAALAAVCMAVLHRAWFGTWWPQSLGGTAVLYFAASGALGAGLGDLLLFRSFLIIGPRLAMLVLALSPLFSTLIAWVTPLRERLSLQAIAGIVVTVAGVAWVVGEPKREEPAAHREGRFGRGLLLAVAGTAFIAGGFVLSKMGFAAAVEGPGMAFGATLVRVTAATACCLVALPLIGATRSTLRAFRNRRAMAIVAAGTAVGPVIGIWLSMAAIHWAPTGIVTALMSTAPIMMIPFTWAADGERPSRRSVAGTLLAVSGAFLIFLRETPAGP